ncbi:peptidase M16 [Leucothrix arctica]|uniref:Peptidase M16 n=2 Tax=Leucothrix arctica TaxID=1481894 RepID=A0A317C8G7_9GAMM|nr:peptidase M16 [Leucothrix arctica]
MRNCRLLLAAITLVTSSAMAESTATTPEKAPSVSEKVLKNGLKVLVKEDHRAPIAVVQVWYRVGTSYEHEGITGLSHALEHMMFKGTTKRKSGDFEVVLSRIGAQNNAFTSQDYTAYYEVLAAKHIETAFELEGDRMRNLVLDKDEFAKEIEVVKEERRMRTDDNPNGVMREQFNAVAYLNNPYRAPVIGWMNDLDHMNLDDLKDWYKKWYGPNNATLVVAGDVDPEKVFELAEKYFGHYEKSVLPEVKPRTEIPQIGKREIRIKAPAKVPSFRMGFKTPGLITAKQGKVEEWEPYALDVLANVLDGGSSARLTKKLIRGKEIAAGTGVGYMSYGRMPEMFIMTGVPATDVSVDTLRKAFMEEIELMKTTLVTQDELDRVTAQVIASEIYQRDSVQHMATTLGMLESTGIGWQLMDEYEEKILAVTAEQIQTVAKKYLNEDQMTFAELVPQSLTEGAK